MKRIFSFVLVLCIVFSTLGVVSAAESEITLEELIEKYPHGTYWNGGDPETYTLIPCDHHYDCTLSGSCGCNSFRGLGIQCLGFAYQIATLIYGGNQYIERTPVYDSSSLENLKAGDIVRFKDGTHSIFITAVDGDIVTYADCNSDHHCIIRWEQTILKSTIAATFTYLDPAPYAWGSGGGGCDCSREYDGNYMCVTGGSTLNIRSGHGTSHSIIGSIPDGAIVYVSKANGEWAHVYYNGIEGYVSMQYLELQHSHSYELLYEDEHPHKEYYKCDCGDFYYTGFDGEIEDCIDCILAFCEQYGHSYDNECDNYCNHCGSERETTHIYDNDCDTDCNECGEERETTHAYDNACDAECNICSETREVGEHIYDNRCDVDCNECGDLRETEHIFDNEHDADCGECGFVREVTLSGDVNSDGVVNNKDFGVLRQFLNNWDVEIDQLASDVNRDGVVNNKDLGILRQYLNGWDVELK